MRKDLWWKAALVLAVLTIAGFLIRARLQGEAKAEGKGGPPGGGDRVIPVLTAPVVVRDMPIYLDGLGTVQAFNTVTVKPQVDGKIINVAFKEGQEVKRGDLLVQIDPRSFEIQRAQAEAALARDRAQLKGDRAALERSLAMQKDGLATQSQIDAQRAAVERGEALLRADQAQIDAARLSLDFARVTAPIDGVTGVRLVDAGNVVRAADPSGLVVITQVDPIAVIFTLPQDDLPKITKEQQSGKLTVEALARDGRTKLGVGELTLIDNQINQTTATIRLKAVFPNAARAMWPNQFVKARLLLSTKKGARVIPLAAVQRGQDGPFVYVVGQDQRASVRRVTIDVTEGDLAVLASGVEPGEMVVTDGQYQLRQGARVAPKGSSSAGPPRAPPSGTPSSRPPQAPASGAPK